MAVKSKWKFSIAQNIAVDLSFSCPAYGRVSSCFFSGIQVHDLSALKGKSQHHP